MEIIKNYIENCFAPFEQNEKVLAAKAELLGVMEDKYNDIIDEGKSVNEAIGTVISEFGDISELKNELGLSVGDSLSTEDNNAELTEAESNGATSEKRVATISISKDEAKKFIRAAQAKGRRIGFGVFMCINCVSALLFAYYLREYHISTLPSFGVAALLLFVAIAVGVFIFAGVTYEQYEKYEKCCIALDEETLAYVKERSRRAKSWFGIRIAVGVALCIVSPAAYFVISEIHFLPTILLLASIGIGVALIVSAGISSDGYSKLLDKTDDAE